MGKFCSRACGRLSTSATLISVGIIQIIAGLILLKSKYVYLLSVPNFWTAFGNIGVGCLLGISAVTWKTINRKTSKYAARRGLLAALASSVMLLNITTAAMLIIDEGKKLLSIQLDESSKISAKEILAYAYAASVCSPIICIVISSTFLIGICFMTKARSRKSLDFKDVLNEDNTQIYSWVYTPKLPKPDPEVLRAALSSSSSDSGTSSSESDSDSSYEIPIRVRRDISPNLYLSSQPDISGQSTIQNGSSRRDYVAKSIRSEYSKNGRVSFEDESGLDKNLSPKQQQEFQNRSCSSYEREKANILDTYENEENFVSNQSRAISEVLSELSSGVDTHKYINSPNIAREKHLDQTEQDFDYRLELTKNMHLIKDEIIKALNSSSTYQEESQSSDATLNISNQSLVHHGKVHRTSTADNSKVQQELKCLDDSAIYLDSTIAPQNVNEESLTPRMINIHKNSLSNSMLNKSLQAISAPKEDLSTSVRNLNFRRQLPSKLIPVSTPVISDGKRYIVSPNQFSPSPGRVKPYSKTKNSYNKYLHTGFSSFKTGRKADEVDSLNLPKKHNSLLMTDPMTSISEMPAEEMYYPVLPSTSTQTSGYMSASYDESDEDSDTIHSTHPSKSHSFMMEKSEWTDIPLDNRCRSASFHSENYSYQRERSSDLSSTSKSAIITPIRSGKVAKKFKISVI